MQFLLAIVNNPIIYNTSVRLVSKAMSEGPLTTAIRAKLSERLTPHHLEVINESYMHNAPPGSESHFKVVVISEKFENVPLIQRHRLVNKALDDELKNGIHALSIVAKTPAQWEQSDKHVAPSPNCRGGFGK